MGRSVFDTPECVLIHLPIVNSQLSFGCTQRTTFDDLNNLDPQLTPSTFRQD